MADYSSIVHGNVQFPLPDQGSGIGGAGASLLRDADPALFYLLEFYAAMITRHLGTRLLAEASNAGVMKLTSAVAETLPLDPEPYLTSAAFKFPLLSAHRQKRRFNYEGQFKFAVDTIEVSYALPTLTSGAAERLTPILNGVAAVVDNRTERGADPSYAPTGAVLGARVWPLGGVARAEVKDIGFGAYAPTEKLYYPAVFITVELEHRSSDAPSDFLDFGGADIALDLPAGPDGALLADAVLADASV